MSSNKAKKNARRAAHARKIEEIRRIADLESLNRSRAQTVVASAESVSSPLIVGGTP